MADILHADAFNEPEVAAYFRRKERVLRPVGTLLFLCSLPLLLPLMLLVRVTSRGPALYRQRRIGKEGREFVLYKLRTMYDGAESLTGPVWCQPNDSRITPLGRVLRLLHLDELPQLLNVARGEMDLVGPRPERPEIAEELVAEVPDYLSRTRVLPGITGLAQINLPPDVSYDCVRRKLMLDQEYISTASFGLDIRMILCTGLRLLGVRHGRAVRWFGLERDVQVATMVDSDPSPNAGGKDPGRTALTPWLTGEVGKGRSDSPSKGTQAPFNVHPRQTRAAAATADPQTPPSSAERAESEDFARPGKPK